MTTPLVVRDDLSKRRALSKSTLTSFDACPTQAWHDIHHRLPLIPQERITFGSATDAAVETAIKFIRAGQPVSEATSMEAAAEVLERDGVPVDIAAIEKALTLFMVQVAPHFDLSHARLQEHISGSIAELGEVDGHPDVWLPDDGIFDVKTSARAKKDLATVELGFYALLAQEVRGEPVKRVGYWTYVRVTRPYWQLLEWEVTDDLLQWTVEKAAAYVRAKRADDVLNAKSQDHPNNWSMTAGPQYGPGQCHTCQYSVMCPIAFRGASDDNAA